MSAPRLIWLDVDPGHDDATAILLAVHSPNLKLLGLSSTHGNAGSHYTALNAARCLVAFGAPDDIKVYPGATKPLILPAKHDPEIHGEDGLGGVEGLPPWDSPAVQARFDWRIEAGFKMQVRAIEGMAAAIRNARQAGGGSAKVAIISTGPMTNVALFASVYPELLGAVEEFVFMGGGVGVGNRSAVAEYNILCDPHATQIVLNVPVKKSMIPLNVTHTAIATKQRQAYLLDPSVTTYAETEGTTLPIATSPTRYALSTILTFFADTYKAVFGFNDGPPLHDALTIAYLARPELFQSKRYRVDVELSGIHCIGETVVDVWDYRRCGEDDWGTTGKNCLVAEKLEVEKFFEYLQECVTRCEVRLGG